MFNRSTFMAITLLMVSSVSAKVVMIESVAQYNELNKGTLVTMFTASWCGPCKQVKPHYIALSDVITDVTFCIVDFDAEQLKSIDTSIKSIPTFVFSHKGTEIEKVIGGMSKNKLKGFIEKNKSITLGKEFKEEAPKFLTADEYYKKGVANYRIVLETCQKKGVSSQDLIAVITPLAQDEEVALLVEACMKPDSTTEVFELMKSYQRGMKEALSAYKPHQDPQDSFVKYSLNLINYTLSAPNYAAVNEWQMAMMGKYQAKIGDSLWQILAEVSSS